MEYMNGPGYTNSVKEMFENIKNEQEKKQEEQREESIADMAGFFRRMWRETRAGLLEEGVPEDLVDEATLSFFRLASNGSNR